MTKEICVCVCLCVCVCCVIVCVFELLLEIYLRFTFFKPRHANNDVIGRKAGLVKGRGGGPGREIDAYNLSIWLSRPICLLFFSSNEDSSPFCDWNGCEWKLQEGVGRAREGEEFRHNSGWVRREEEKEEKERRKQKRATSTEFLVVIISAPKFNYIFRWKKQRK